MKLQHLSGGHDALRDRRLTLRQDDDAACRQLLRVAFAEIAAARQVQRDLLQGRARKHQVFREIQEVAIARAGGDEVERSIENSETLRHEVDRAPQRKLLYA
jgi:hypothetical protein